MVVLGLLALACSLLVGVASLLLLLGLVVELFLELSDQKVAPFLDVDGGTSLNYPIEKEVGAVTKLVFQKIPVTIGILEHAKGIDLVLFRIEVKGILLEFLHGYGTLINDFNVLESDVFDILPWVVLKELVTQLDELVVYCFVYCLSFGDFLGSSVNSVDVFFIIIYLCIIFPEGFRISFYFLESFTS